MTLPSSDGQPSPFPPPAITTTVPPAAAASSELDKPLNTAIAAKVRRPRRHSERHARLTQLAEMGNLAAGLAHELKNPLSTLKLNLQLLQEDLAAMPGTEAAQHRAVGLWKVADRLTQTLEDFLRYAGRLELRLQPTAINTLVQDLVDFLEPQAQAGKIRIHTSLAPENPICLLDPHLAKQALFNLLINAVQAMSGPGTAGEAETAAKPSGDLIIRTHMGRNHAIVDIADTGIGIPKENLKRIFDAYFTTKKGGTGLGLPTARRIVEEHQGHMTVTSEPGKGTNFRIEFPLAAPRKT